MLYFEDFMEAIENLPGELNDSLTTVRQLDIRAQSVLDPLTEASKTFFEDCKYNRLSEYQKNMRFTEIIQEYEKALSNCREKREIVEKIYATYQKLMRKLDAELEKFRLELEADNSGITEQIEQRINAILGKTPNSTAKPERRRQRFRYQPANHFKNPFLMRRKIIGQACRTALKSSAVRQAFPPKTGNVFADGRTGSQKSFRMKISAAHRLPKSTSIRGLVDNYQPRVKSLDEGSIRRTRPIERVEDSSLYRTENSLEIKQHQEGCDAETTTYANDFGLITARNSPAFGLPGTSELTEKGMPPTNSFRLQRVGPASVSSDISDLQGKAVSSTLLEHRLTNVSSPSGWQGVPSGRDRRSRPSRRIGRDIFSEEGIPDSAHPIESANFDDTHSTTPSTTVENFFESNSFGFVSDVKLDNPEEDLEDEDQKRYCVCNDVSYGDMIACDNPNCPFEWFHYSCVSLTVAPKGDWYCPSCIKTFSGTKSMKKRMNRR